MRDESCIKFGAITCAIFKLIFAAGIEKVVDQFQAMLANYDICAIGQASSQVHMAIVFFLRSTSTFRHCPIPVTRGFLEAVVDFQLRNLSVMTYCLKYPTIGRAKNVVAYIFSSTVNVFGPLVPLLVRHYDAVTLMSRTVGIWTIEAGKAGKRSATPKQVSKLSVLLDFLALDQPKEVYNAAYNVLLLLGDDKRGSTASFTEDHLDSSTVRLQIELLDPGAIEDVRKYQVEICLWCGSFKAAGDVSLARYKLCSFCSFAMCRSLYPRLC